MHLLSDQNTFGNSWMFTVPIYHPGSLDLWETASPTLDKEPKSLKNQMLVNNTRHFYSASLSCKVIKMFGNWTI